jgi:chaperonin GroES
MNVKPLADRVIVEPLEAAEKTAGGLYIPDNAKEKPQKGRIVAAGPGKLSDSGSLMKMEVKAGDTILYGKYSGTEVSIEGKEYLIMRESDVLAVI